MGAENEENPEGWNKEVKQEIEQQKEEYEQTEKEQVQRETDEKDPGSRLWITLDACTPKQSTDPTKEDLLGHGYCKEQYNAQNEQTGTLLGIQPW